MNRPLLLDLDGTLTDPYAGISRCIVHALKTLGIPSPAADALKTWIGPPLRTSFETWFRSNSIDADAGQALQIYRERFSTKGLFENEVYPGIGALLGQLQTRVPGLYLATAKPGIYAGQILDHFGLSQFFSAIYGSELDGRYTDKSELLELLLHKEQLNPGECIMIGDRHHDIAAAKTHGMTSFGVLWGYGSRTELEAAGADLIIESVQEMKQILVEN
jgi:phosphoglycolate phosphatase